MHTLARFLRWLADRMDPPLAQPEGGGPPKPPGPR
jgi:hypothetical protein